MMGNHLRTLEKLNEMHKGFNANSLLNLYDMDQDCTVSLQLSYY
jgi:hypothetical protein